MPKSTSRRTLQPVFDPLDLLDGEPIMQPLPTNGYHSESSDEDGNLFGGLHFEPDESKPNGAATNGAAINGTATNGAALNGSAGINGAAAKSELTASEFSVGEFLRNASHSVGPAFALNGASNGTAHFAVNGISDELADDLDAQELAAAKAAFEAVARPPASSDALATGPGGEAHLNGDSGWNVAATPNDGDATRLANGQLGLDQLGPDQPSPTPIGASRNGDAHLSAADSGADSAAEPAAPPIAFQTDTSGEIARHPSPADAPPTIDAEPARSSIEPSSNGNGSPAAASAPAGAVEPHPAAGSLFVPYLVTEIRELRSRSQRRRSWWRRIFG